MGIGDHIGEPVDSHGNYPDGTPAAPSYPEQQKINSDASADADEQKRLADQKAAADAAAAAKAADDQYKSHYEYGGWAGGAAEAAGRYAGLGAAAQGRQGEQLALGAVNDDRNANGQARGQQEDAAGGQLSMAQALAARANGSMPSIAGMRANQDINRALADQSSIAASARGPAALALAQQNQANQSAAAMGNISNSAQINTAQEQLNNTLAAGQAYGATGQSYGAIRGGDQSLMGADAGISIAQANINAAQRAANDQYQLGMTGYETGVQGAQLQAQGNEIAGERGAYATQQGIDLAHDQNSTAKTTPWISGGLGAGAAATGGIVTGLLFPGGGTKDPSGSVSSGANSSGTSAGPGGFAGASAGDGSGAYNTGASIGASPNVSDVGSAGAGFMPQSTQMFKAPTAGAAQAPTASDDRAKVSTALSTPHTDTTGPAASSVSMARMLAARDAEAERKAKADKYGGLVSGAINGLGQAFAQQAPQARITPVVAPQQQITLSDDRTKLAAAWDQGHAAGVASETTRAIDANAPKARATSADRAADNRRDAPEYFHGEGALSYIVNHPLTEPGPVGKAMGRAYGRMVDPQPAQQPGAPIAHVPETAAPPVDLRDRTPASLTTDFDSQVRDRFGSPPPVMLQPTQASGTPDYFNAPQSVALSDARTKLSMSSALGSRQVGTLGKSVSNDDVSDFARSLRSTPYAYKDGYAQREGQQPGEVNVGPVAQDVEKSRIGATIVKPDAQGTGMRTLDQTKMVKGLGAVAASHQDQLDEHDRTLSLMARRLGGGR